MTKTQRIKQEKLAEQSEAGNSAAQPESAKSEEAKRRAAEVKAQMAPEELKALREQKLASREAAEPEPAEPAPAKATEPDAPDPEAEPEDRASAQQSLWKQKLVAMKAAASGSTGTDHRSLINAMGPRLAALHASAAAQRAARERLERFGPRSAEPYPTETVTFGGLTWAMPTGMHHDGLLEKLQANAWRPGELLFTLPWSAGRIMLDIGAHIGTISIPRIVFGLSEAAYCAEPEPRNYAALLQNIEANGLEGFVMADNIAVSDFEGEGTLTLSERSTGHRLEHVQRDIPSAEVRVRTVDAWVQDLGIDPADISFIKTDTQGADARIIAGATSLLREHRQIVWQMEFHPLGIRKSQQQLEEVYAIIREHFTHFSDTRQRRTVFRPTSELADALAHVGGPRAPQFVNLLLLNLDERD